MLILLGPVLKKKVSTGQKRYKMDDSAYINQYTWQGKLEEDKYLIPPTALQDNGWSDGLKRGHVK